jgi:DNA-directed RNA polymerase subunit H (RpoH/RPB5)
MGKAEDIKTPEEMAAIYAQYGIEDTGLPKVIDPVRRERMGRLLPEWR